MALSENAPPHEFCAPDLLACFRKIGVEAELYDARPEPIPTKGGHYKPEDATCPHGVTFWLLPSQAQRTIWDAAQTIHLDIQYMVDPVE